MSNERMGQVASDAASGFDGYSQTDDTVIRDTDHWYMETDAEDHIELNSKDPENVALPFPSSVPAPLDSQVPVLRELPEKEYKHREGQANDCLQGIWEALGHLAWQFRDKVRKATSNKTTTKSWANVKILSKELRHLRRLYNHNRAIMISLNRFNSVNPLYPLLSAEDCKLSTAITDANAPGIRGEQLPWIWRISNASRTSEDIYLKECMCANSPL